MSATADMVDAIDVILRDGGTLRLRPPAAEDAERCSSSSPALSERASTCASTASAPSTAGSSSRCSTPTGPSAARCRLLEVDGDERIVALASYVRLRDSDAARDGVRGRRRRAGARDRHAAARAARGAGRRGTGSRASSPRCSPRTPALLAVFARRRLRGRARSATAARSSCGSRSRRRSEYRDARRRARPHRRRRLARARSSSRASVAVIGASRRRGSIGGELFRNILAADFAGAAYPVNLQGRAGRRRPRLQLGRGDPGAGRPRRDLPARRAGARRGRGRRSRHGVRALCVISAGFAETGAEGRERQERLLALVRAHGARLRRPELPRHRRPPPFGLNATFAPRALPARHASASRRRAARSGSRCSRRRRERGLGFSAFVSIGNKADVSSNDLLEWWEDDDDTDLVAALPRVVRQPARVLAHRAAASRAASRSSR